MTTKVKITLNVTQADLNRQIVKEKLEDAQIGRRLCARTYETAPTAESGEACEAASLWVMKLTNLLSELS